MEYLTLPISRREQPPCNSGSILKSHVENFCLLDRPKIREINALKELFYALVGKSCDETRRLVSMALAANPNTPRPIAFFLAMEPIEIAAPMLLHSQIFDSSDLIAIIDQTGDNHLKVIAHRADNDLSVKAKIRQKLSVANPGVHTAVTGLEEGSSDQGDLNNSPASSERDALLPTNMQPDIEVVAEEISLSENKAAKRSSAHERMLNLARRGGRLGKSQNKDGSAIPAIYPAEFGKELLFIARSRHYRELASRIEDVCGLRADLINKLIADKNAGILACLLQVLNIPDYLAGRLLLLICPVTGRDSRIFKKIIREFSKLDSAAASAFFAELDPGFSLPEMLPVSQHTTRSPNDRRIRLDRELVREKPGQDLVEETSIALAG